MFETCFIHIGHSKTGTTSIQRTLFANADVLAKHGILYPTAEPQHNCVAASFQSETEASFRMTRGEAPEAARARLAKRMARLTEQIAASDAHTLVISTEHFNILSESEVAALAEWVRSIARTGKVVCYMRHPVAHAASKVQQRVKIRALRLADAERKLEFYKFAKRLPKWVDAFGKDNMVFRAFERDQLHQGDAIADFLQVIGFDGPEGAVEPAFRNRSLSAAALLIADEITRIAPRSEYPDLNNSYLFEIDGPKYALSTEQIAALRTKAEPHLAYLRDEFGIALTEPKAGDETGRSIAGAFTADTLASLARILVNAPTVPDHGAEP